MARIATVVWADYQFEVRVEQTASSNSNQYDGENWERKWVWLTNGPMPKTFNWFETPWGKMHCMGPFENADDAHKDVMNYLSDLGNAIKEATNNTGIRE